MRQTQGTSGWQLSLVVVLLSCIVTLGAVPTPAQAPTPTPAPIGNRNVEGVTLGETATELVQEVGEPITTQAEGDITMYVYLAPTGNALEYVHVVDGNAVAIGLSPTDNPSPGGKNAPFPALLGVALNDPASKLDVIPKSQLLSTKQLGGGDGTIHTYHDDTFDYIFIEQNGIVNNISAYLPNDVVDGLSSSTEPLLHDGSSIANAIVLGAATEDVGIHSKYMYMQYQRCANNGTWNATKQFLLHQGGHTYHRLQVTCSTDGSTRSFYFDVTKFIGK